MTVTLYKPALVVSLLPSFERLAQLFDGRFVELAKLAQQAA